MIYIPHESDGHRDHKRTHEIIVESVRRAGDEAYQECAGKPWWVKTVLCYEVWTPLQKIQYVEDITKYIDQKITALGKHTSQITLVPYDDAVKGLNRYRGGMTGKGTYCECFGLLRTEKIF